MSINPADLGADTSKYRVNRATRYCCFGKVPVPSCHAVLKVIFGIFLIASAIGVVFFWGSFQRGFISGLQWVSGLDTIHGCFILLISNIIGALLFLPCLPFTLASGFLYGWAGGLAIVIISSAIAALCAFLTARYLARGFIETQLTIKVPKFRAIDNAINKNGFRVVLLIRSSPVHPYGLCNYLFGLTSITLRDYMSASMLGMFPAMVLEVYLGTAMKNVADIIHGEEGHSGTVFWGGLALTVALTIGGTVWIKRKVNEELNKFDHYPELNKHLPTSSSTSASSSSSSSSSYGKNNLNHNNHNTHHHHHTSVITRTRINSNKPTSSIVTLNNLKLNNPEGYHNDLHSSGDDSSGEDLDTSTCQSVTRPLWIQNQTNTHTLLSTEGDGGNGGIGEERSTDLDSDDLLDDTLDSNTSLGLNRTSSARDRERERLRETASDDDERHSDMDDESVHTHLLSS